MPHLLTTRRGWENEHLATFLLSQISYLAHPLTVADDLGVDLLCTLFEPRTVKNSKLHFPKQAFAIQIKSNEKPVNVAGKQEYLKDLEVPFFLGVVERETSSLDIYSGELIPNFFCAKGTNVALKLNPRKTPIKMKPTGEWRESKKNSV